MLTSTIVAGAAIATSIALPQNCDQTATAVTGGAWTNPIVWGLEDPCYPNNDNCAQSWCVELHNAPQITVDTSPWITSLDLRGSWLYGTSDVNLICFDTAVIDGATSGSVTVHGGMRITTLFGAGEVLGNVRLVGSQLQLAGARLSGQTIEVIGLVQPERFARLSVSDVCELVDDVRIVGGVNGSFGHCDLLRKTGPGVATIDCNMWCYNDDAFIRVEEGTLRVDAQGGFCYSVEVDTGAAFECNGPMDHEWGSNITGEGTYRILPGADVDSSGTFEIADLDLAGGRLELSGSNNTVETLTVDTGNNQVSLVGDIAVTDFLHFARGTLGPGTTWLDGIGLLESLGASQILDGRDIVVRPNGILTNSIGFVIGTNGATIHVEPGGCYIHNDAWLTMPFGEDETAAFINDGLWDRTSPGDTVIDWTFKTKGEVHLRSGTTLFRRFTQSDGLTRLVDATLGMTAHHPMRFNGGTLAGNGALRGELICSATIDLFRTDDEIAELTARDITLRPSAHFECTVSAPRGGAGPRCDRITAIPYQVQLGGTLRVTFTDDSVPIAGTRFEVIRAAAITDAFDTVTLPSLPNGLRWRTFVDGGTYVVEIADDVGASR